MEARTFMGVFCQVLGRDGTRKKEGEEITWMPHKSVPKFVPLSKEGMNLKEGRWGNLDESLSFLSHPLAHILASSNGFLLCCADTTTNMTYIVCNPVTREFRIVPEPHKSHFSVAIGFVCKTIGADMSLTGMSFEIYRVKAKGVMTTLEIESFSSVTGEWTEHFPVSPIPIRIKALKVPAVVHSDRIIWKSFKSMVVFDPYRDESVQVIQFPEENVIHIACYTGYSRVLGNSEGKIYYGRTNPLEFEVWILDDMEKGVWTLKHKVAFEEISRANSDSMVNHFYIRQFHPMDSGLILVSRGSMLYWYSRVTGRLSVAGSDVTIARACFQYEWPLDPCVDESHLNV